MQPWWNLHSFWSSKRRHWPRVLGHSDFCWTQKRLENWEGSKESRKSPEEVKLDGLVVMKHGHNMSQSWFICSWGYGIYGEVDQCIFSLSVGSREFDIHDSFVSYQIIRCISNLILLPNLNRSNLAQLLRILWGRPGLLCWKFMKIRRSRSLSKGKNQQGDGLGSWKGDGRWVAGATSQKSQKITQFWTLESRSLSLFTNTHLTPTRSCWQKWPANCQTFPVQIHAA